jgi:hypothetical protein
MKTTFTTQIAVLGNNTGIEVPETNLSALGAGKKPAVTVTVAGYSYQSTVAVMGGKFMIALSKAHRNAAKIQGGDLVEVTLELETAPRVVEVPAELAAALEQANLQNAFAALAVSRRKEHVRQVEEAKSQDTKDRRIQKIVSSLAA